MGEIAESMCNGDLCAQCGAFMNEDCIDQGFPIYCNDCHRENKFGDDVPKESDFLDIPLNVQEKIEALSLNLMDIRNKKGNPKYTLAERLEIIEIVTPFLCD